MIIKEFGLRLILDEGIIAENFEAVELGIEMIGEGLLEDGEMDYILEEGELVGVSGFGEEDTELDGLEVELAKLDELVLLGEEGLDGFVELDGGVYLA